jgi:hypothetical protein
MGIYSLAYGSTHWEKEIWIVCLLIDRISLVLVKLSLNESCKMKLSWIQNSVCVNPFEDLSNGVLTCHGDLRIDLEMQQAIE